MSSFSIPVDSLCNVQLAIRLKQTPDGLVFGFETISSSINPSSTDLDGTQSSSPFSLNFQAEQFDGSPILRISASPNTDHDFSRRDTSTEVKATDDTIRCDQLFQQSEGLLLPAETPMLYAPESGIKPEEPQLTASTAWSYEYLHKSALEPFAVSGSIYSSADPWNNGSPCGDEYGFDGVAPFDAGMSYSSAPTLPDIVYSNDFSPSISPSDLSSSSESSSPRPSSPAASTSQWSSSSPPALRRTASSSSQSSRGASPDSDSYNRRRKIPCTIPGCASRFTSQYTLKVHLEAHKPKLRTFFPCTLGCSERFSRQHDRLRHEVAKHGKVCEWVCSDCRRFFSSSRTLRNHRCPVAMAEGKTRWVT